MKSQTIIIAVVGIIALALLGMWGYAKSGAPAVQASSSGVASVLSVPVTSHDFGTISMKNGDVSQDFTVTNSGNAPVTVSTILTSCMCTSALLIEPDGTTKGPFGMPGMGYVPPANETIPPGASRIIRVVFNPAAHGPAGVGVIDRVVTLSDTSNGTLELKIHAVVTP